MKTLVLLISLIMLSVASYARPTTRNRGSKASQQSGAITIDGDLSDLLAHPGAVIVEGGLLDAPRIIPNYGGALGHKYPDRSIPTGFNWSRLVYLWDAETATFYLGADVTNPVDKGANAGGETTAWDNDGDGNPLTNRNGPVWWWYTDDALSPDLDVSEWYHGHLGFDTVSPWSYVYWYSVNCGMGSPLGWVNEPPTLEVAPSPWFGRGDFEMRLPLAGLMPELIGAQLTRLQFTSQTDDDWDGGDDWTSQFGHDWD